MDTDFWWGFAVGGSIVIALSILASVATIVLASKELREDSEVPDAGRADDNIRRKESYPP
jgi:hypothetical protein